jgi:Pyruvate/2-oxoacid:ferredoxin oxidoreductase delta subunit
MAESEEKDPTEQSWSIPSRSQHKEFAVSGRLVFGRDKNQTANPQCVVAPRKKLPNGAVNTVGKDGRLLGFPALSGVKEAEQHPGMMPAPEVLTLVDLARREVEGLDYANVMNELTDLGPDGRLLLYSRDGKLLRHELFEDPRICKDIPRGAVVHNLEQKPADVSGWRVHEFYIDPKGCLGEVCSRCARVCPESAIHLRGVGADSFCEIDPTGCKGCFICWVECTRKSADCILIDGKVFDSDLRAAHFGE